MLFFYFIPLTRIPLIVALLLKEISSPLSVLLHKRTR